MEFLIGLSGADFVLLASDMMSMRSIMILTSEHDKFNVLSHHQLLLAIGEEGEADRLRERILAETSLANLRMGRPWSTSETAHFTRTLMADALRSRSPFSVNLLIAGVDEDVATRKADITDSSIQSSTDIPIYKNPIPSLYWMDYLASLHRLPFAAHGYGAYFVLGLLDARYKSDMTLKDALSILREVLHELKSRFIVQIPKLNVRMIDAKGIHSVSIESWSIEEQLSWNITQNDKSSVQVI